MVIVAILYNKYRVSKKSGRIQTPIKIQFNFNLYSKDDYKIRIYGTLHYKYREKKE